jgi:exopolysaccharide biosynthesis polyprenyl glycosylphosphotransferase
MSATVSSTSRGAEVTFELASATAGARPLQRSARVLLAARVLADVAAIGMALGLAFALRFGVGLLELNEAPVDVRGHVVASALWLFGVLSVMAAHRLYDEDTLTSRRSEVSRIRGAVVEGVAIVATAVFLFHLIRVSRGWFLMVVSLSFVLLVTERGLARRAIARARARGRFRRPVVLVGGADSVPDTVEFDVVARLSPEELRVQLDALTGGAEPRRGIASTGILLLADTRPSDELWDLVVRAGGAGLPVYVASPVRSVSTDRLTTREIDGRTIVKVAPPALIGVRAFEKRAFDVVVSATMLVVFAVPMAVIAAAVLVSSGRPILYGQRRVGRAGRVFQMWKFRTMRVDAEAETGPVWATKDDPRRTRLGRVLRTWSLDELPQLWNVLVGDMSVVGPRPERPELVEEFVEGVTWYRHRHRIKPGITGLAQVSGLRGDTDLAPRVDADNAYIEHWSLLLDVRLALRTVVEVVRHRNAG